jgi:ABC-type uncharacterized transport system auxiliary subunit
MKNPGKPEGDYMTMPVHHKISGSSRPGRPWRRPSVTLSLILALLVALLLSGCGKPPVLINRYILEYAPPVLPRLPQLDTGIKVALFAVDETINRQEMVYQANPYRTGTYWYNRWRVNPGYLVTDYLTRDLGDSRLFKAVFSHDSSGPARFRLEGGVVEFQENDTPGLWHAALTLNITLLDTDQENIADRVMFQRSYRTQEPMSTRTPPGLAAALSSAMQQLSRQIIDDVYRAVQQRLGTPKG